MKKKKLSTPLLNSLIASAKDADERFRALFDNFDDSIVIFNRKGNFIDVNRGLCKAAGYPKEKIMRMGVKLVLPAGRKGIWQKHLRDMWRKREVKWEGKAQRSDGKIRTIDFHSSKTIYEGKEALICIGRDITDEKEIEDALKITSDAINASITPIAISNFKGYLTYANKAFVKMWGYSSEAEVKRIHASKFWANIKEIYRVVSLPLRGKSWSGEMLAIRKDGSVFWTQGSFSVVKGVTGSPNVIMGSFNDVTLRRKAEEVLKRDKAVIERTIKEQTKRLIRAQEQLNIAKRLSELGLLSSTVAHELRNPLGVMQVAIFNILHKSKDNRIRKNLIHLQNKIMESERIIGRLLTFSKVKQLICDKVDLLKVLNEVISAQEQKFPLHKVRVIKVVDKNVSYIIEADQMLLKEVFSNILENSYQSMKNNKGRIIVDIDRSSNRDIHVRIKDSGTGIDKHDIGHVFDPFFTKKPTGIGLGLPICKEIIELHKGKISIKSKINTGTDVNITLPIEAT